MESVESYIVTKPCGCVWKYEKQITYLSKIVVKPCPEHPCNEPFKLHAISWNELMEVKRQYILKNEYITKNE